MSLTLIIQFLVLTAVVSGVLIFFLKKTLFDSTQGAVNRLNRETEEVRGKQAELNQKIKEANEELQRRRKEADDLVQKMKDDAEQKAKEERDKIIKKARADSEEIITKAQQTKESVRKVLEKENDLKEIDFTANIMNRVLSEKIIGDINYSIISEFIEGLEKVDMAVVGEEVDTVEATTSIPLDAKLTQRLGEVFKKKLNREVKIVNKQDKMIISGVVLRFGSLVLDGSLAASIKETSIKLKEMLEKGMEI